MNCKTRKRTTASKRVDLCNDVTFDKSPVRKCMECLSLLKEGYNKGANEVMTESEFL